MAVENSVQLWVQFETDGDYERVDLREGESITMNDKIQDLRDLKKIFTSFTQSFTVPASKQNNKALGHMLRGDIVGSDPRSFKPAYLEINNNHFRSGLVKVEGARASSGVVNSYTLRFFGELVHIPQLLSEYHLKDLDLGEYLVDLTDQQIYDLLTTDPDTTTITGLDNNLAENLRYILASYGERYFYDSGTGLYENISSTDGDQQIVTTETRNNNGLGSELTDQQLVNIANTSTTRDRGLSGEKLDGVYLQGLKRSLRQEAILEKLEAFNFDSQVTSLIRFSRGNDANGKPTANKSEVVSGQEHFFNTDEFTKSYMLMHVKDEDQIVGGKILWDNEWEGFRNRGDRTYVSLSPYMRNGRNYRRYYIRASATVPAGQDVTVRMFSTASDSQVWSTNLTPSRTSNASTYGSGTRIQGNITNGVGTGTNLVSGERIEFTRFIWNQFYFTVESNNEEEVDIDNLAITISQEEADGGSFPFYNFTRTVTEYSNTAGSLDGSGASQIPNISLINLLTGWQNMWNLTYYYDRDANNDPIIVARTLDNFYSNASERDLTEYVDNQEYDIKAPAFYSDIEFKFEDSNSFLAKEFSSQNNIGYGDEVVNLREDEDGKPTDVLLPKKSYKIKLPFEKVLLNSVNDPNQSNTDLDLVFAWIADSSGSRVSLKPWIHYVERVTLGGSQTVGLLFRADDSNLFNSSTTTVAYNASTDYLRDSDGDTTLTLLFKPQDDVRTENNSGETLYHRYWESTISESFDYRARIVNIKARLPDSFLLNYSLGDLIRIGSEYYRIIKIKANLVDGKSSLELIYLPENLRELVEDFVNTPPEIDSFTAS